MNGDAKTIIKLLSDKIDANGKQFNQRFDDFQKHMDEKITRSDKDKQRQLDNHCRDLKSVKKTQGDIKTKLATTTTKLAFVISGAIFAIVFTFDRVAVWLDHLISR